MLSPPFFFYLASNAPAIIIGMTKKNGIVKGVMDGNLDWGVIML